MAKVEFKNLGKKFEKSRGSTAREWAIRNLTFEVNDNEFITFVGPSGCGKSTTLNMIAGLEDISEGEFYVNGKKQNDLMPKDRDIAMVFQSYALYPHLSVKENIGFGLNVRHEKKSYIDQKVAEVAEYLSLENYLEVRPKELSGGQQQRVALARALVRKPTMFLMDEPLSNLDVKLRVSTRKKIREIHNMLNTVTFYVTHDQAEALTMSDKIVVMSEGRAEQIGSPKEVYTKPKNIFVSRFIGNVPMNIVKGKIENEYFIGEDFAMKIKIPEGKLKSINIEDGKEVYLGFRAENISNTKLMKETYPEGIITATVGHVEYLGSEQYVYCDGGWSGSVIFKMSGKDDIEEKQNLEIVLDLNKLHFFDINTKEAL